MANSIDLLVILLACVSQGSSLLFSKNQKLVSIVRKNFRQQQKHTKLYLNQFVNADYSSLPESSQNSQLPDSFQDAVQRAAVLSLKCFDSGIKYCRIDFDTTVGDMTYTSLKNSMPLVKELTTILANKLDLVTSISAPTNVDNNTTTPVDIQKDFYDEINNADGRGTIRLFFPDMGAAVLARRDWKMGTPVAEVPSCIRTANIQNDPILVHDKVAIILCPLYSETDSVKRVLDLCVANGTPCIMINPELINMDQGFGVRK